MAKQRFRPPFHPESLEYGLATVTIAGNYLKEKINALTTSDDIAIGVEIKTDPLGVNSPVTKYDKATEQLIGSLYEETDVRVKGEEGMNSWPDDKTPALDVHVDPIDGTELFVTYIKELINWMQLPEDKRPPRPICG